MTFGLAPFFMIPHIFSLRFIVVLLFVYSFRKKKSSFAVSKQICISTSFKGYVAPISGAHTYQKERNAMFSLIEKIY